jgi:DNA-binding LytR/AlgR family response regulator
MNEHISDESDMGLRRTTSEHIGKGKTPREGLVMSPPLLPRLAIRIKGRTRFVSADCVLVVLAQGNYVLLQCESASYPLRESITAIQKQLEPYGFVRIHRSVLVNRLWVEEIRPYLTGDYRLRIRGGKEFKVTRTYKCNLKSLAELWLSNDSFLDR